MLGAAGASLAHLTGCGGGSGGDAGMGNAGAMTSPAPPQVDPAAATSTESRPADHRPRPGSDRCRWRTQLCTLGAAGKHAIPNRHQHRHAGLQRSAAGTGAEIAPGREDQHPGPEPSGRGDHCSLARPGRSGRNGWWPAPGHRARRPVAGELHRRQSGIHLLVPSSCSRLDRAPGGDGTGRIADRRRPRNGRVGSAPHLGRRRPGAGVSGQAFHGIGADRLHAERRRSPERLYRGHAPGEWRHRPGLAGAPAMGPVALAQRLQRPSS